MIQQHLVLLVELTLFAQLREPSDRLGLTAR